jgi:hypothetical protein
MSVTIKSGKEIVDDFFAELQKLEGVDKDIGDLLNRLHRDDRLTHTNLKNELERMRGEAADEK